VPELIEATFTCAKCGGPAARVVVVPAGVPAPPPKMGPGRSPLAAEVILVDDARVLIEAVGFGGSMGGTEIDDALGKILAAVATADPAALYAAHREVGRFWCPTCRASYCGRCWTLAPIFDDDYPGWFEELQGRCPAGHERQIYD